MAISTPPPINTLILVCCHAPFAGDNPYDESQWYLASFQTGEHTTFIKHIEQGLRLLFRHNFPRNSHASDRAILVFSGGATKHKLTRRTEAESYRLIAEYLLSQLHQPSDSTVITPDSEWLQMQLVKDDLLDMVFEEQWATDSYQNVLLSLLGFALWRDEASRRRVAPYQAYSNSNSVQRDGAAALARPSTLVIVSHLFKERRFVELHVPAVLALWPPAAAAARETQKMETVYVGVDPEFTPEELREVQAGERERGYCAWLADPYGLGTFLFEKQWQRGWVKSTFLGDYETRLGKMCAQDKTRDRVMAVVENMVAGKKI